MNVISMNVVSMRRSQRITLLALVILTVLLIYAAYSRWTASIPETTHQSKFDFRVQAVHVQASRHKPSMADLSSAWSLRPNFINLGPSNMSHSTKAPLIPHIFHQIWDTDEVPRMYIKWIETWSQKHPNWQHWFWTLSDVRQLVVAHYPDYLTLFDSYEKPVFRADAGRYFILHRYGGVYVDLDMHCIRPMDPWTWYSRCLVSEENYEHVFVVREQNQTNIMNGFIASTPSHPFLNHVIQSLDEAARKYFGDYLYATGPGFFDAALRRYAASLPSTADRVTVLPPFYFLPTYDPSESDVISGKCFPTRMRGMPSTAQIVCRHLAERSFHNDVDPLAYADHHWFHAYMFDDAWKKSTAVDVFDAVPALKSAATASDQFS